MGVILTYQFIELVHVAQGQETIAGSEESIFLSGVYHREVEPLQFYSVVASKSLATIFFSVIWLVGAVVIVMVKTRRPRGANPADLERIGKAGGLGEMLEESQRVAEEQSAKKQ